jgi:hypothetical protein
MQNMKHGKLSLSLSIVSCLPFLDATLRFIATFMGQFDGYERTQQLLLPTRNCYYSTVYCFVIWQCYFDRLHSYINMVIMVVIIVIM